MIDANRFFQACEAINVLIVGDMMIDKYLSGQVRRISPEAPVPVLELQNEENRPGGAANVALNVQAMGAKAFLCSVIGSDRHAQQLLQLCTQENLAEHGIIQSQERITTVKTRVMAASQHLLRVDQEDTFPLTATESAALLNRLQQILDEQTIHVIIFQDYNKGVLSPGVIEAVIKTARSRKIPMVVDPKKANFFKFQHVDVFKPNLKEIREALPFVVSPELDSLKKAAAVLFEKLKARQILVTLSEKGIFVADGKNCKIVPTQPRNIADVCGAGDTVISITALGKALGLELTDIAILANLAGGQVCEKAGVVPVNKQQLKEEYLNMITRS